MPPSSKHTPKTFTLLVENSSGVTEFLVGTAMMDDRSVISPLGARVVSGKGGGLSWSTLQEALELERWAVAHADVLREGRVVYQS